MTKRRSRASLKSAAEENMRPLFEKIATFGMLREFADTNGQMSKFGGFGIIGSSKPLEHLFGVIAGLPESTGAKHFDEVLDDALEACGFPQCRADGSTGRSSATLSGQIPLRGGLVHAEAARGSLASNPITIHPNPVSRPA